MFVDWVYLENIWFISTIAWLFCPFWSPILLILPLRHIQASPDSPVQVIFSRNLGSWLKLLLCCGHSILVIGGERDWDPRAFISVSVQKGYWIYLNMSTSHAQPGPSGGSASGVGATSGRNPSASSGRGGQQGEKETKPTKLSKAPSTSARR